ncbi:hypothetical protein GL267_008735 [Acidithiobacillus ferrianus]|uniref:Uncharacterized protein n=2 Tax=Acidithiobacillus ferrianus TaxID=2678518 RepID=A0A845U8B0_9PROT|nr:hypothetical protein [Acidithiobacillus ferrianus]NDU42081.1 hypothetical protein [Acidithiobacillus ferrianus]
MPHPFCQQGQSGGGLRGALRVLRVLRVPGLRLHAFQATEGPWWGATAARDGRGYEWLGGVVPGCVNNNY